MKFLQYGYNLSEIKSLNGYKIKARIMMIEIEDMEKTLQKIKNKEQFKKISNKLEKLKAKYFEL